MRRFPCSWQILRTKLGSIRRSRSKKQSELKRGRQSGLELLEPRQLLAVDSLNLGAYWGFDSTSGTAAVDETSSSNDGTLIGGTWLPTGGATGGGLNLDGVNDYVDIDTVANDITGDFAISGWFKADASASTQRQAVLGVNSSTGANKFLIFIGTGSGDNDKLVLHEDAAGGWQTASTDVVGDDQWHHFAVTRSGTTLTLYVDGVEQMSYTSTVSFSSTDQWSIGQEYDNSTRSDWLDGSVDEFRIYDHALNTDEVIQLASARFTEGDTISVSTNADENDGNYGKGDLSLREALFLADKVNGADDITFSSDLNGGTIQLSGDQLQVRSDVSIVGPGRDFLTIDANNDSRVMYVDINTVVSLSGLTMTGGGQENFGAGIYSCATLTLDDMRLTWNTATQAGGAINQHSASLTITNSEIVDNTAGNRFGGGGIRLVVSDLIVESSLIARNSSDSGGGGISAEKTNLDLVNTTIASNTTTGTTNGGGIYLKSSQSKTAQLTNVTITANDAEQGDGGGIYVDGTNVDVTVDNSIIAGNEINSGADDVAGTFNSSSTNNLVGVSDGSTGLSGTLVGTSGSPQATGFGAFGDYGGPTDVYSLLPTSDAIDAGANSAISSGVDTDQRGTGDLPPVMEPLNKL